MTSLTLHYKNEFMKLKMLTISMQMVIRKGVQNIQNMGYISAYKSVPQLLIIEYFPKS